MENYKNSTMVFSKQLHYGGRNFIKYNSKTRKYVTGNTASTAVSSSAGIEIYSVTTKEIKNIVRQLENLGYSEHEVRWNTGKDTYDSIRESGL